MLGPLDFHSPPAWFCRESRSLGVCDQDMLAKFDSAQQGS